VPYHDEIDGTGDLVLTGNGSEHDLARDLAVSAGRRLMDLRAHEPLGGDVLRKAGDSLAHEFLVGELARRRPDDAVLSEEGKDNPVRLTAARVWIVDPLDGTREFGDVGRTDWAVHVALWERGALAAGAVALPAQGVVLSTADYPTRRARTTPFPSWIEDATGAKALPTGLRILVSRSRPPAFVQRLAADIGAELVPMGSAGAKAAAVIRGEYDAYIHAGGQYEWDSAAPVAVALAAGLHASRIDGSTLRYNQADVSVPDILISPAWLAPGLLSAIANATAAGQSSALAQHRPSTPSDPEFQP
jgi:3'(2'), 5'-bisphosphate nucleotidase